MTRIQRETPPTPSDPLLPPGPSELTGSSTAVEQALANFQSELIEELAELRGKLGAQEREARRLTGLLGQQKDEAARLALKLSAAERRRDSSLEALVLQQGIDKELECERSRNRKELAALRDANWTLGGQREEAERTQLDLEARVRTIEKHLHAEKQLTATLEEALIDLETQSNKIRAEGDDWKKKAHQAEEELQSLMKQRPLLDRTKVTVQNPDQDSTLKSTHYHIPSPMISNGPIQHTRPIAAEACTLCQQRNAQCTGGHPACENYASDNLNYHSIDTPPKQAADQTKPAWQLSPRGAAKVHLVPAAHGYAFQVKAGERFRVVDIHGQQVVDFMAWCPPYKHSKEYLSMAYTRHAIGGSAPPQVGECLHTNRDEPMFRLVADTVKTHDMLYMACNPGFYKRLGQEGHRSCATNIAEAMERFGMESYLEVTDPFNIFQNTPYYSLKALNCSRAGDYVEFEALKDAVCAVSSCPYDRDGFNGGHVTDVAVVTGI
jgi:uncharacterized protein YcgI (DUF1989 family)